MVHGNVRRAARPLLWGVLVALGFLAVDGGLTTVATAPAQATPVNPYAGTSISVGTPSITSSDTTVAITDLQVGAANPSDLVPVQLEVDSGSLAFGTTTGITFSPSGVTSGNFVSLIGTQTDVNAALATLTLTKDTADAVTLSVTLFDPSKDFVCDTGHFYRMVDAQVTYAQAKTDAASAFGGNGYVVTPTTDPENTCVYSNIMSKAASGTANITWIGAVETYASPTVTVTWDQGPESGTDFWSKTAGAVGTSGTPIGGAFAKWDVEAISGTLVYQPNARISGGSPQEPCVVYYKSTDNDSTWHDVGCSGSNQYVIELDDYQLETATVAVSFNGASPTPTPTTTDPSLAMTGTSDEIPPATMAYVITGGILFVILVVFGGYLGWSGRRR